MANMNEKTVRIATRWACIDQRGEVMAVGVHKPKTARLAVRRYRDQFKLEEREGADKVPDEQIWRWMAADHGCKMIQVDLLAHYKDIPKGIPINFDGDQSLHMEMLRQEVADGQSVSEG